MLPLEVLQTVAAGDSHCAQGQPSVQSLAKKQHTAQSAPPVYCQQWVTEA